MEICILFLNFEHNTSNNSKSRLHAEGIFIKSKSTLLLIKDNADFFSQTDVEYFILFLLQKLKRLSCCFILNSKNSLCLPYEAPKEFSGTGCGFENLFQ